MYKCFPCLCIDFFLFTGLHLAVKIITGDLKKCHTEHPMLFTKGLAVIQKMDFSDVINPGNAGCLLWRYIDYHLFFCRHQGSSLKGITVFAVSVCGEHCSLFHAHVNA